AHYLPSLTLTSSSSRGKKPSMASRREKELRRRPVRGGEEVPAVEREVEISEIAEDEDEESYADDPLVLKGSRRPAEPPKEPAKDYWGVDDDGNWGSKSGNSGRPVEPQEHRISRIMQRGALESAVALLVHLAGLGFYVYVHWLQFAFFFLAFLRDIMPDSYIRQLLTKFCDFVFTTVIFPLAMFVAVGFWGIYAIDREMIYPFRLEEYNPAILNHFWHTTIVVAVLVELLLVFHRFPTTRNAVAMIFSYSTAYIVWIVVIVSVADYWVYPFLKVMPPPLISVFFAACFFATLGIYFLGQLVGHWRWRASLAHARTAGWLVGRWNRLAVRIAAAMSLGDFSQYAEDHARIFVYVMALGETSGALYGAIVDSLQEYPPVRLRGSLSNSFVFVRLANRLPRWARDGQRWQQFQPYKKVAGLLAITQVHDADDLETAADSFTSVSKRFKSTLAATKCVVFASEEDLEGATLPDNFTRVEFDNSRSFTKPEVQLNATALNNIVAELVVSVAETVLRSIKGLRDRLETGGKMDVLMSPLDGREGENDDETKLSRTQKMGRIHKHMADLYLLTGQLQPACDNFCHALSLLSRDPLWEGSANEGLGATLIMKKKHDDIRQGIKTADLSIPSNVFGFLKVSQRILKPRDPSRKRAPTDLTPTTASSGGQGGTMANGKSSSSFHGRRPRSPLPDAQEDSLDSIEEGGVKTEADDEETRKLLQKDLVVDRFTRAELHYRKAGANGGVPRIELLFKFARYLVSQDRHKAATEILQKIFWTSGFIDEKDKTTLYQAMAKVFESMGYHRKSSLLLYWAARHATSLAVRLQDYYEAHTLLAQSLPGYKLSIAPANSVVEATNSEPCGWPLLQARLMKELVYLTQHTDQNSLLIQLTRNLSSDNLISPLPLSEFPQICTFRPKQFPQHLRPHKTPGSSTSKGPFIVSQLGHWKKEQRPEFLWVVNDSGEISMDITNPLEFELRKLLWEGVPITACPSSLSLPAREKQDFTLTALPQEPGRLELTGALKFALNCYEHTVFGIRSKCSVRVAGNPLIRVVPSLPQLRVHVLPQFHTAERNRDSSGSGSIESGTSPMRRGDAQRSSVGPRIEIDMTDGECCEVEFRMMCQKDTPVESLSLGVETSPGNPNHKPEELCLITCPPPEVVNSLVPFGRKECRTFVVNVKAKFPTYYRVKNDFVSTLSKQQPCIDQTQTNIVEDGGIFLAKKLPESRVASPFRSTAIKKASGSSASVAKRSLLEQPARHVHGLDSSLPSPTLVDSLNIDVPVRTSSDISYPSSSDSLSVPGISPLTRKKGRDRGVARTGSTRSTHNRKLAKYDEWDFNQYDDLKRASIRSDPGDRKREGSGVLTRSPVSSGGSTPLLKSPSLASRTSSLAGDGELSPSGVSCDSAAFVYEHSSLPRPSRGSPKSPGHRPPVVRKGGSGINKNNISLPSQLRHNTLAILPTEVAVTARFTLNYSGGDGCKAGYHRQMESSVKVRVHPSLYFDDFGISAYPGKMDMFCLSFYVHNKSTRVLYVTCSHNSGEEGSPEQINLRLLPKQKHKVYLSLRRFSLPLDLENSAKESKVAQLYSDHLARLVTVQWEQEGDGGRSGVSSLESIRLPSSLLNLIQPIPLLIDLEVNGQELATGRDITQECSVGTPVNVKLTLTNNTNCIISPSWLLVDACEFLGHRISHELTGRMINSGNLLQRTPQLDPGQTYNHQLSFVFFYKGHYQVEFKAYVLSTLSPPQNQQHRHVSSPPFSSSSSSSPSLPLRTTEETDGGKTSRSYIEQRVTSPILTSCPKSPTQNGESLLEYCGKFGGPVFAPLKITPCPFRCKLVPLPAEDVTSAALTSSSQARTDKLLPISEAGEIVKKEARLSHQESPSLLAKKEQISLAASSPGLVRRERGTRRHLNSYSSMHKRLSHLCKRQVSGPVLSLQVVESRTSRHRS
ncbi:Trafficking protein particle complex subunit 9, partial [Geodia barretti]